MQKPQFTLRPAAPEDASGILEIYAPFILNTTVTFELTVPSREEFAQRIKNVTAAYPWIVCEREGKIVGYAYSARHAERAAYGFSANLSVYVDPKYSRRGIGRLLCNEIIGLSREMGVCHLFSAVTVPNEPSFALHRALGFVQCGYFNRAGFKFDSWRDLAWFELELSDSPPPSLLPIGEVLKKHFGEENKKTVIF